MNRSRSLFLTISLAVLLPVASGVLWSAVAAAREDDGEDSLYKYLSIFSEVFSLVRSSYVDATDPDALLGGALEGVTDALDPFSNLVPAAALADYELSQRLAVARSGLLLAHDRGIAYVASVEPGSPAAAAGFERGDVLAQVDGEETRGLPLWRIEQKLAGDPGRAVAFRLLRQGETRDLALTTADYPAPAPELRDEGGIAVLVPGRLAADSATRIRPLLAGLAERGASKLLVDLRGAGTGEIEAAYGVGALFARGPLGVLDARGTVRRQFHSDAEPVWRGELAVLVDSGTLGAGELLAAILRDGAGAKLVGTETFGWAGERSFLELSGGARLHLTTAFFAGPNGAPLSSGLEPDVEVDELSRSFGERERPLRELILERGLELLRTGSSTDRAAA
jgi:carboxyl-terminal processing protease